MDREAQFHFVTICFPLLVCGLIVAYLYLKDRNNGSEHLGQRTIPGFQFRTLNRVGV
jgi:hypothetical protein